MTRVVLVSLVLLLSVAPARASPLTLVDTQPDGSCGQICQGSTFGFNLGGWLATEFTLAGAYTLTSVEGWIQPFVGGDLMVAIYSDGGSIPGTSLFSKKVVLPSSPYYPFSFDLADWYGATGVSWTLGPGSYWVVFGVPYASMPSGAMPSTSAQPLLNGAWAYSGHGFEQGWNWSPFIDLGVRVIGEGSAPSVPEPSGIAFLAMAALGFASRSQRGRRLVSRPGRGVQNV